MPQKLGRKKALPLTFASLISQEIYVALTTMSRKGDPQAQPLPGGGVATVVGVTK